MTEATVEEPSWRRLARLKAWGRWSSLALCLIVSGVGIAVMIPNLGGYPMRFSDEGVYISQAWAVATRGTLANYTYWYDHPPLGWIQLAGWLTATNALDRYGGASILAGREFMIIIRFVTCILLYVLARRVGMRRLWAAFAVLLFALSPLSTHFGRFVMLDSIALPWLLGAFIFALSAKRHIMGAVGAAVCFSVAVLTKETIALMGPVVLLLFWGHYRGSSNRKYVLLVFPVLAGLLTAFYGLYALTKRELLPGEGHVSLLGTLYWQLSGRSGGGSVLDPGSDTRNLVMLWLNLDYRLPLLGVVATVIGLLIRRLRPLALAVIVQLLMLLRSGYTPFMYVIVMLPFMALVAAGVFDRFWPRMAMGFGRHAVRPLWYRILIRAVPATVVAALVVGFGYVTVPSWSASLRHQLSADEDRPQRDALAWIAANIPKTRQIVVEGENWLDLQTLGFNRPEAAWVYKVDTDPEIRSALHGWEGIDYLVLNRETINAAPRELPLIQEAISHSETIQEFGEGSASVVVMRVHKNE